MRKYLAVLAPVMLVLLACSPAREEVVEPSPIPDAELIEAAPPPAEVPEVALEAAPVSPASTLPPAQPIPTPDPNIWRVEGVVLGDGQVPLADVCVVIGPRGCQPVSPHTDRRGVFYFDVPKIPTVFYDLTFVRDGYQPVWMRIRPEGPSVYNVFLRPQ